LANANQRQFTQNHGSYLCNIVAQTITSYEPMREIRLLVFPLGRSRSAASGGPHPG